MAATKAEQAILAKYVGWGGLPGAFQNPNTKAYGKGLEDVGRRLLGALTPAEYRTAERSTQYAHYTAENVIRSMWDAVRDMGFKGGNVFEPGMGVGHFLGMMPQDLAAASRYQGVEMDHVTADIARLLYPQSGVQRKDFTRMPVPENSFDLAIGNPPFGDIVIKADPKYAARSLMLHDYFFAKSLDSVRPGGLLAFVTSAGTMNKISPDARNYMAERAEFVGGVRLPSTAFKKNAGTEVTTDILFFKKRPAPVKLEGAGDLSWTKTQVLDLPDRNGGVTKGHVNQYFVDHPEQILGEHGMYDKLQANLRYGVRERPGSDLTTELKAALDRLPKDVMTAPPTMEERARLDFESGQKKDGTYYVGKDGQLMQYSGGAGRPVQGRGKGVKGGLTAADREKVTHLIPIRDALRDVFIADLADHAPGAAAARKALNKAYDSFVEKYGPINLATFQYRRPTIVQQEVARQAAREQAREDDEYFRPGDFDETAMVAEKKTNSEVAQARDQARTLAEAQGRKFDEGDFNPDDMPDTVIEQRPNIAPFMGDPESYRLRAIENYNDATGEHSKKPIFERSVLQREVEPELKTAGDGVMWSMNQFGKFDLPAIARQMKRTPESLVEELGDNVFRVPGQGQTYQTKDEYLSGDIVSKLETARKLAPSEPDIRRNLPALEAAVPVPLSPAQISMSLGMPWIPQQHFRDFAEALGLGRPHIERSDAMGQWFIKSTPSSTKRHQQPAPGAKTAALAEWATNKMSAYELLDHAMNRMPPKIYEEERDENGNKRMVFDPVASQAAQDKVVALKDAFVTWTKTEQAQARRRVGQDLQRRTQPRGSADLRRLLHDHARHRRRLEMAPAPDQGNRPHRPGG